MAKQSHVRIKRIWWKSAAACLARSGDVMDAIRAVHPGAEMVAIDGRGCLLGDAIIYSDGRVGIIQITPSTTPYNTAAHL